MRERHRHLVWSMLLLMTIVMAFDIRALPVSDHTAPRLKVAATIFPLYDMLRTISGPTVDVVLLLPPGASPHTFAAKPSTIRALTNSAAVFAIGHQLDDWATRLAQRAGVSRTIIVDAQIALRTWESQTRNDAMEQAKPVDRRRPPAHGEGHAEAMGTPPVQEDGHRHGDVDPHYWLTISNAMRMVQTMADTLSDLDPVAKTDYQQRAAAYQQQLQIVDDDIRRLLAGLPQRHMATFHPAFGYFAAAYDLDLVATFTPASGQEPTPRHVQQFLRQLRAAQLRVLFVEPQLPREPLHGLAHDLGVSLMELDPLGGGQGRETYVAMMRFNAAQIVAAARE